MELLILEKGFVQDTLWLTFVQSGYLKGEYMPTLDNCGTVDGNPVVMEWKPRVLNRDLWNWPREG